MSAIVDCLLSLRDRMSSSIRSDGIFDTANRKSMSRKKWNFSEGDMLRPTDLSQGNLRQNEPNSPVIGNEKKRSTSETKFQNVFRNPIMSGILVILIS